MGEMLMERINIWLFNLVNSLAGRSSIADDFMVLCAIAFPYLFIVLLWWLFFNKKRKEYRSPAIFAGEAAVLGCLLNFAITLIYYHPRPFVLSIGVQLIPHAPDSSFSSDHGTFLFSIACMLLYFKPTRIIGTGAFAGAALCSFARVYCGVHFTFDIAGSFVIAILATSLLFLLHGSVEKLNSSILRKLRFLIGDS